MRRNALLAGELLARHIDIVEIAAIEDELENVALTGAILLLLLLQLATAYGMNVWNREIFGALENRDSSRVNGGLPRCSTPRPTR